MGKVVATLLVSASLLSLSAATLSTTVGPLVSLSNGASGTLRYWPRQRLRITGFRFDGQVPKAFFFMGKGNPYSDVDKLITFYRRKENKGLPRTDPDHDPPSFYYVPTYGLSGPLNGPVTKETGGSIRLDLKPKDLKDITWILLYGTQTNTQIAFWKRP